MGLRLSFVACELVCLVGSNEAAPHSPRQIVLRNRASTSLQDRPIEGGAPELLWEEAGPREDVIGASDLHDVGFRFLGPAL
jgi:hypothetical protein